MPRVDVAGTYLAPSSTIGEASRSRPLIEGLAAHAEVDRTERMAASEGDSSDWSGAPRPILSVARSATDRDTRELSDAGRSTRQAARPRLPARAAANESDR